MKVYKNKIPLYHIDVYRLEGLSQDLGLEEMMEDDGVCVIEWPIYIDERLPKEYLNINLKWIDDTTREITISARGKKYEEILEALTC